MKNSILVLIIIVFLQSCLVTDRVYLTQAQITNKEPAVRENGLKISCGFPGDGKLVGLLLSFDDVTHPRHIKNISVKFLPDNKQKIELNDVSMFYWQQKIPCHGAAFFDIPDSARTTVVNGAGVYYKFYFISHHNINAKTVEIAVLVDFENGKSITIKDNFI